MVATHDTNRRNSVPSGAFLVVGFTLIIAHLLDILGPLEQDWLFFLGVANLAAISLGVNRNRPRPQWQWWIVFSALVILLVGGLLAFDMKTLGNLSSTRSAIPDLVTIPGYILLAVGLLGFSRARGRGAIDQFDTILDGLMISLSVLAVSWVYLIQPIVDPISTPSTTRLSLALYPALSLFLVVMTVRIAFASDEKRSISYWFLLATMFSMFVGDAMYLLTELHILPNSDKVIAVPYALAYTFAGACALHPSMSALTRSTGRHEANYRKLQVVLVTLALATPGLLIFGERNAPIVDRSVIFVVDMILVAAATSRVFRAFWVSKRSEKELAHIAAHDTLTGLPNRRLVVDRLSAPGRNSDDSPHKVALLFIDLDQFKLVNDSYGHSYGDRLLIGVAERLRKNIRRDDLVARLGGDEFLIVLQDIDSIEAAERIADQIRNCLRLPFNIDDNELFITGSVGLALSEAPNSSSAEYLLRDADTAMYQAKAAGRDTVVTFNTAMQTEVVRRLELKFDLRSAIEKNQLFLVYQPIVGARNGKLEGVEALLRWQHPTLGLISPTTFIPLAEESGLILEIGTWVMEQAIAERARLQRDRSVDHNFYIAINLSAAQLVDDSLATRIEQSLQSNGISGDKICIELTESMVMENPEKSISMLTSLKRSSTRLAIDDFGSGYSSLAYLTKFPVDKLKIDKSFVDSLSNEGTVDESLIAAIVAMSKSLGISTTAEGVETEEQERRLRDLGCDSLQGFLISRPVPTADLRTVIGKLSGGHHGFAGIGQLTKSNFRFNADTVSEINNV